MEIIKKCQYQFFGKSKSRNYRDIVADLVQSYTTLGYYMSLQVRFVDGHPHKAVSD